MKKKIIRAELIEGVDVYTGDGKRIDNVTTALPAKYTIEPFADGGIRFRRAGEAGAGDPWVEVPAANVRARVVLETADGK